MDNENLISESVEQNSNDVAELIKTVEDMKKNYVPREELEKERAEKKQIFNAYVNGQKLEEESREAPVDFDALVQRVRCAGERPKDVNLIQDIITLRKEAIKRGFPDPFTFKGGGPNSLGVDDDAIATANKVEAGFQEMIDMSQGDNYIFLTEYQRNVEDPILPRKGPKKR